MLGYEFLREEESTPLEYDESVLPTLNMISSSLRGK
jgi:hypothetical protein